MTSEQMLLIFGALSSVFFTKFIKCFFFLDQYAEEPDMRKKVIAYALKNGTLFSMNFAVVILVLLVDELHLLH